MNTNEISGKRQLEFLADFDYIREAGTAGEEKAAERIQKTLDSFGVESHLEEFSFDTFQIKKSKAESNRAIHKRIHSNRIWKMRKHSRGRAGSTICVCRER